MNYSVWMENRKSVREFTDKKVPAALAEKMQSYHDGAVKRLLPERKTELRIFGDSAKEALEGAAGYHQFLIGAPMYLVLLSEVGPRDLENAGYIMEDLVLKATELGLGSCWITFADGEQIKKALDIQSGLAVAAIAAIGYGAPARKRPRINVLTMSQVDIPAQRRYMEPKRSVRDLVYMENWGSHHNLEDFIGFYDDMLWEAFYAVSLAPSYLNRQAYGFLIRDGKIHLVARPDEYTTEADGRLSIGIAMLHFDAVAEKWAGKVRWDFEPDAAPGLPQGHKVVAVCAV